VRVVCSTGTTPSVASSSVCSETPGWQSMKYSAIRDWGSAEHCASALSSPSASSTLKLINAFLSALIASSDTVPAVTPAIRTSEPSTMPKALSNSTA
jgi:hypothetical protein